MATKENIIINNKPCFLYETENPTSILIQAIDDYDLEVFDSEVLNIRELSNEKFILLAFLVDSWNNDLLLYLKEKYGSDNDVD